MAERLLGDHTTNDDSDLWLPIGVLAAMARRHHRPAARTLAEAVRRGRHWRACLDALEAAGGRALIVATVGASDIAGLVQAATVEELADAAQVVAAPWDAWADDVPSLRFIAGARGGRTAESQPMAGPMAWTAPRIRVPTAAHLDEAVPTAALLSRLQPRDSRSAVATLRARLDPDTDAALRAAATAGTGPQRLVALTILGERGVTDYVPAASSLLHEEAGRSEPARGEAGMARLAYRRYLEQLPPETTLPLARRWFGEPWPLSLVAERILALHATPADRPLLEIAGEDALATSKMYRLCSVIDALGTVGARESLPFLARVYGTAPYSWARRRVASALVPHRRDPIAQALLVEALWDCEPESQALACGAVHVGSATGDRLAEIGADDFEEDSVRDAARLALAGTSAPR